MAALTVALVLLALVAGVLAGVWLGRSLTAGHDERELSRAREGLANARTEAAEARTGAAESEAMVAHVQAQVARAEAERDAARSRVEEIAADRQAMVDQFRLLSNEVAERQGKQVDTVTAQRLQATHDLLTPVAVTLQQFQARLVEVEKERVAMATDLQAHVRSVRDTGEALRKETASLVTALRKPQVRGSWGETQLKRVAEMSGMVERCDFDVQLTSQSDGQTLRPDMRVHLAEGKYVFVDSKVPLSAFLDAAETDDEQQRTAHLASFARHVRTHVDQLSGKKYWKAGESPEFVILFLPERGVLRGRPGAAARPPRVRRRARRGAGHPDHADRHAAGGGLRLEAGGPRRDGRRGVPRGPRAARPAGPDGQPVRQARPGAADQRQRLQRDRRDRRGPGAGPGPAVPDLKVTEKELAALTSVDEPVRQIQAAELVDDATQVEPMVGRRGRRSSEPPEAETLWRADPDLDELVDDDADRARAAAEDDERRQA